MAVVGNTTNPNDIVLRGYEKNDMHGLAEDFSRVAKAGLAESYDIFTQPNSFFNNAVLSSKMQDFFVKDTYDKNDPEFQSVERVNEHNSMMAALYKNDVQGLCEAAPLGAYNPVVGITFPMHKNLLMTTVFDKGAIPKDVATSPQFTLTMETRTLYAPDGREIDMFLEQNKIKDIVESAVPRKDIVINLPEDETTDVLALLGATNRATANVSRASRITKLVIANAWTEVGEEYMDTDGTIKVLEGAAAAKNKVVPVAPISFVAQYGQYDRGFAKRINMVVSTDGADGVRNEIFMLFGTMHKNKFTFNATSANVKAVILSAALDVSSAAYQTPKVKWSARTDFFEISEAPHFTVTLSPEETRDIQAMYNVNQLTKLMSMIKLTMVNYKDDKILENLDESFLNLPATSKISGAFNFTPPDGYLGSHIAWRYETFMDYLDTQVTTLLQILNDENMTVTIFGRPELIRKITPKEYTYTTPPSIGPVMLDYKKTVKTSDNRIYQFISSNKLRNDNNLIIILCPRNTTRVIYKIFDYQLYVGNEIRDTDNYQLPAVTSFERFLFVQYQPIQGRIQIVNPSGLKEDIDNNQPIGNRMMNDYTANRRTYDEATKTWVDNSAYIPTDIPPQSVMQPVSKNAGEFKFPTQNYKYAIQGPNYAVDHPSPEKVPTP